MELNVYRQQPNKKIRFSYAYTQTGHTTLKLIILTKSEIVHIMAVYVKWRMYQNCIVSNSYDDILSREL